MKIQAKKKIVFGGHSGGVYALAEGIVEGTVFSGSSDRFVGCWNLVQGKQEDFVLEFPSPVYALLTLKEQRMLLAGTGDGTFYEIDIDKKEIVKTIPLHTAQIFDLDHSPKHRMLFSASGDGTFSVLHAETFEVKQQTKITEQKVRSVAVSPKEDLLAVTCGDGNIKIYSLPQLEELYSFPAHELSANTVCWHPDGKYLLSGGRDAYLKAWDAKNNFALLFSVPAHNFALYNICFSPDKKLFATASRDKSMKLWDAENFNLLLRCGNDGQDGHKNSVNRLLWNEYGLISAADDRSLIAWEIEYV